MRSLISFSYRRSLGILFPVAALVLFCGFNLRLLEFDVSNRALIPPNHPDRRTHERVRAEFGSDLVAQVYAESASLWDPARLEVLRSINDALAGLPYVQRVDSLFTLPDIRDVDGFLEISPLLDTLPGSAEGRARRRQSALENPLILRNALAPDGTATALTLYLDPAAMERVPLARVQEDIEAVLAPHRPAFDALFQLGNPRLNTWLTRALKQDQVRVLPAALLLLFLILAFNQRSLLAGAIPIINGLVATVLTFGLMALYGVPVNLLNYILPALILVVGATEDMHILHEYRTQLSTGKSGPEAIANTAGAIWLALFLTALTTILGFAATALSDLPILRDFGLVAMIGMTIRFLVCILVLPAMLRWFSRKPSAHREARLIPDALGSRVSAFILERCVPRGGILLGLLVIIALGSFLLIKNIRLSNDLISFIDADSEVYREMERSSEKLAGPKILFLTLYDKPDSFAEPVHLERLAAIVNYLRGIPEIDAANSFAGVVTRINQQLRGGDPGDLRLPESAIAVKQLLFLLNLEDFSAYISRDLARANIVIRCDIHDSTALNALVGEIASELESGRFGPQFFTLTGEAILVADAVDSIVKAQVFSLGGMAAVLFVIIALLFLSFRCGALTLLSNLFPIVFIFGIMGATGVSLNVGTCMIAAITLGIAIDDTLHLLVLFNRELKATKNESLAIGNAIRHVINPIVSTTLALSVGFLVLTFTSFEPVRQFGLLSACVLLVALVTDFVVTPVLFANTRLVTLWDILGLSLRRKLLKESVLFQGFSSWQAKKLILASNIEEFPAGALVIREGDVGEKMYLVLEGELEAFVGEGDDLTLLNKIRLGEVLGEIAIVAREKRSANVRAVTPTRLLSLDTQSLERLRRFSPFLSSRLFLNLAGIIGHRLIQRTRETTQPFQNP